MEDADRVRKVTDTGINARIDREIENCVRFYATQGKTEISRWIEELDLEWDIDRALEANASLLGLTGLVLGVFHDRRWLIVPGVVLPFLLQHAVQGWCPPIPVLRRLGYRTRKEIDREKYALKALRGDFQDIPPSPRGDPIERAEKALQAARM
jgi:hypothetical protein